METVKRALEEARGVGMGAVAEALKTLADYTRQVLHG